jgi:flavin-binding protein dodecin
MSVVKIIRIVGNSPESWAKAAAAGVQEVAKTVRNIQGVEATDFTAKVDANGRIKEYRCTVNIAFVVGGRGTEAAVSGPKKATGRR